MPSPTDIKPPFTAETAKMKVKAAENGWNSRNPARVAMAYTEDTDWRNRDEFFVGREKVIQFLTRKWEKEFDYRLMKELWCYTDNRISVRFEYEWHDGKGQWYRTHGNEHWEYEASGLMRRRDMSANDTLIEASQRRYLRPEEVEEKKRRDEAGIDYIMVADE
ncbi:hypothetical protein BSKO_12389 [Bryopsis sp. KO-2023]|nr:hypothetical protein BSKO_12389 [Bryopsis sp. KO-2023]